MSEENNAEPTETHGGYHAVDVAKAHGVDTMFTLSGAHVFPMYDAAIKGEPPVSLIDVRQEQTAVFAAEAMGKLTRKPGLAVLTAGPGVTNGTSAIAQAFYSGAPLVVIGGRAPAASWGRGSLQEVDHPPIFKTITKFAETAETFDDIAPVVDQAFIAAGSAHRGSAFVDIPMDEFYQEGVNTHVSRGVDTSVREANPDDVAQIAQLLTDAKHPVVVLGTDVWADGAEENALRFVEELGIPAIANGMGRGVIPGGHPLLMTKARSKAFNNADLVIVVGAPLDFRLGYGSFGGREGNDPAVTVHIQDSPAQISSHAELGASASGSLGAIFDALVTGVQMAPGRPDWSGWVADLQAVVSQAKETEKEILTSDASPIHPARIYGELLPRLADDAIVIGDGGDFVSFAGKFVEPQRPGSWLDTGPYGCLGHGIGAAMAARIANPQSQVVVMFGDGAVGMSIADVDTLVRHKLPVVMIVGNNSAWGLEKMPMEMLHGYHAAVMLGDNTRYEQIVIALGGGGEYVTDPNEIGPAIDRAFASGIPYMVNISTDLDAQYPRATSGL